MNYKHCGYCGGILKEHKGQFRCVNCDEAMTYVDMLKPGMTFGQVGLIISIMKAIAISLMKLTDLPPFSEGNQTSPESHREAQKPKDEDLDKADKSGRRQSAARSTDARKKGS